MDRSAELRKAKRRHRAGHGRGLGRTESTFAALSITVVVVSLVAIAVCGWIVKTGQVELRLVGVPFLQRVGSGVSAVADAVHSVVTRDKGLSIPGSLLIQSVLPNPRMADEISDGTSSGSGESLESSVGPSVGILPVFASVGEMMTSGVMIDPLTTVSSQVPFSLARLLREPISPAEPGEPELLSLGDLEPVSAGWLVRSEAQAPAGTRAPMTAQPQEAFADQSYGALVAEVASAFRPQVQEVRSDRARQSPVAVGDVLLYGKNPVVAIYHTHSSEAYQASHGTAYLWGSTEGVISVGQALAESLWYDYGISVVHSRRSHDVDEFRTAYSKSALTVESLVSRYLQLKLVLDIHRDATGNDSGGVVTVGGVRAAEVLVLVTTDRYGLPHPNWRSNLSVAQRLQAAFDALYPGLSKGVRQHDDGRFNQHLHPGCLLLEIGDVSNTREEAVNSALCVAHAIASVLSSGV